MEMGLWGVRQISTLMLIFDDLYEIKQGKKLKSDDASVELTSSSDSLDLARSIFPYKMAKTTSLNMHMLVMCFTSFKYCCRVWHLQLATYRWLWLASNVIPPPIVITLEKPPQPAIEQKLCCISMRRYQVEDNTYVRSINRGLHDKICLWIACMHRCQLDQQQSEIVVAVRRCRL
jgi:hypothetical protein